MKLTVGINGLEEVDQLLANAAQNIAKNTVRRGLRRGAEPLQERARALAPRESGEYAESIVIGSTRSDRDGLISIRIGPRGRGKGGTSHYFLGIFFEHGVAPHYLQSGEAGVSARQLTRSDRAGALRIGNEYISGPVLHPGLAPRPHMRPAADMAGQEAVEAFRAYIASEIESRGWNVPDAESVA